MKTTYLKEFLILVGVVIVLFSAGCGPAPPCDTDLVRLDELRLELEIYEEEVANTSSEVEELETKLAEKKNQIETIGDKPEKLEKKVRKLMKGSGRE
jgi:peptidoglycan hydrolase CwlO-like protein